ncbi:TetR/AcrR family transcriptional regulator [Yinghuangia sp. ASG 101]|uniref:TetR/AcrR family transcriptional regulator n=1 Tax=Yinghuangia sp. ASG 101 TaxID=2896848 RepID=UPI001E4ABB2F|nr:TetR/AcrR family transcriptional regulator [Yinghuangia sp. ASG 101]UGQ11664.1 TetR/AcrR family transcriptional regulator [Yinghuangia sp. ASG 101]
MAARRRVGREDSETRARILECAERLMLDEGYAAISYRTLGAKAGVTGALVQYYFPTFDDLFATVVRERSERSLNELVKGLATDRPLRALWKYANNKEATTLTAELVAVANHRKRIRAEMARAGEEARALVLEAVTRTLRGHDLLDEPISPDALVFLITSTPRMVAMEESTGMTTSHAETMAYLERLLDRFEPPDDRPNAGPPHHG